MSVGYVSIYWYLLQFLFYFFLLAAYGTSLFSNFFHQYYHCFIVFSVPPWLSLTTLIKFIPKYFIVFDDFVNGVAFLISICDIALLVYRNVTDFCILVLYPITLLNSFVSSVF